VLSLPGLRRLRFRENLAGEAIPDPSRDAAENAARVALAALALAAFAYQEAQGYDLRSRSLLVPVEAAALELVGRDGTVTQYGLTKEVARDLLREALEKAARFGMRWVHEPISLVPAPKLAQLIRVSRTQTQAGNVEAVD
jgi:CRISPR-associated protein Csb1